MRRPTAWCRVLFILPGVWMAGLLGGPCEGLQHCTNFFPYLPGAMYAGQSPFQMEGIDLERLPWLQYISINLPAVP